MQTADKPLYRQIADLYRDKIKSGELKPGDAFPTEMEVCEAHSVSRHTARDALRLLTEDGLIQRRRRAGTIVIASTPPTFSQTLQDFDSLLQYARDSHLKVDAVSPVDTVDLEQFDLEGSFNKYTGLRAINDGDPIAITNILIRSEFCPKDLATINSVTGPISEWVQRVHAVEVDEVRQRMEAVALSKEQATTLNVRAESPALRTVRRYSSKDGSVFLVSESFHPAGRFAYDISLQKN